MDAIALLMLWNALEHLFSTFTYVCVKVRPLVVDVVVVAAVVAPLVKPSLPELQLCEALIFDYYWFTSSLVIKDCRVLGGCM